MATQTKESTWLHLTGKPSQEDLDEEEALLSADPDAHIPMTTRREIWLVALNAFER